MVQNFATAPSNIMPGIQALTGAVESYGDFQRQKAGKAKAQEVRDKGAQIFKTGTPEEIFDYRMKHPEIGKDFESAYKFQSKQTRDNKLESLRRILIDNEPPADVLIERAEMVQKEGGNFQETLDDAKEAMVNERGAYEKALKEYSMLASKDEWEQYQSGQGKDIGSETKVGAQQFLEDGTLIQSTPQGPRVYNPQQELVTGQAAADAIKKGRAEKIKNERLKSGGKRTAVLEADKELKGEVEAGVISQKKAAEISSLAYKRLENIYKNIDNLNEGIGLLREEGANTGVIDKYLPSFKKATLKMKNLQGRLGLDVLNTTTFGALSAGELAFALETAVPEGMQPKDLADWLEERKNAQEKLADYIESAAIYMGTPGNTVTGWIKKKKLERAQKGKAGGDRSLQDFMQKAKAANPSATDQEITEFYNKNYGGQ